VGGVIGRIAILGIVMSALIAGVALYYLQIYAYYVEVTAEEAGNVQLVSLYSEEPEPILFENFKAINSDSSPVRYRACFETPLSQAMLTETYFTYPDAEPLVAPGWFDCFDANTLGKALETGEAIAFLGVENITYGIDRVVAVYDDGRAFAWHQINHCGEVVFDGNPAPEGCPPAPERLQ
jgi:hypothetical protein